MNLLDGQSDVLWSSPNFYFEGDPREIIPNDPSYGSQYHHPLMKNNLAWDITFGNPNIIIGITDDGVSTTHTDLAPNIWINTDEIAGNGIDDDANGYIDDVQGWDFSSNNNDPNPNSTSNDHGTHVAGISAARTNNAIGVAGVSGHSKIMALQFYGVGAWTAAVCNAAFTYAANNGAKVVNTSYNIDGFVGDPVFTAGMQYMHDAGVLHFNSGWQQQPVKSSPPGFSAICNGGKYGCFRFKKQFQQLWHRHGYFGSGIIHLFYCLIKQLRNEIRNQYVITQCSRSSSIDLVSQSNMEQLPGGSPAFSYS